MDKNTRPRYREVGRGKLIGEFYPFLPVRAAQEATSKLQP